MLFYLITQLIAQQQFIVYSIHIWLHIRINRMLNVVGRIFVVYFVSVYFYYDANNTYPVHIFWMHRMQIQYFFSFHSHFCLKKKNYKISNFYTTNLVTSIGTCIKMCIVCVLWMSAVVTWRCIGIESCAQLVTFY